MRIIHSKDTFFFNIAKLKFIYINSKVLPTLFVLSNFFLYICTTLNHDVKRKRNFLQKYRAVNSDSEGEIGSKSRETG